MEESILLGLTAVALYTLGVVTASAVQALTIRKLKMQNYLNIQNLNRLADEVHAQKKINFKLNTQIAELGLKRNKKGQFESVKTVKLCGVEEGGEG